MNELAKPSSGLERLFSTPSLMRGEDPAVYAELFAQVEELAQPRDVWDQMMVADITNYFWEQQRYRRCTGAIINAKRRRALETIFRDGIGLSADDVETLADIYFGVTRFDGDPLYGLTNPGQVPETRADVVAFLKQHGFDESDIDRVAMETSVDALADLENLARKHEIRREAILRELERRRDRRDAQHEVAGRGRPNGKVALLARDLPEEPPPSASEPSP